LLILGTLQEHSRSANYIGICYAKTRSSAVIEKPHDAPCHWIFR